ncbi:MAG: protein kinase [Myxococcaceae bacterium]|nr:protein kinase [Myxococcaceae bacterium]
MAPKVAPDLDRGRKIAKYEILTRLSVGGMAELFLAYLPGPGGFRKFVAVKQILPDIKKDEQFVKMFLDEARITAAFTHSNIGQVFDLGEEDGELYLAMEFIAGQNLEQLVKRATKKQVPIPMGVACRVIADACLGLHYAHHFTDPSGRPMPVVHRDVSPKNVMVTYGGAVKVIDFGIAKARNRLNRTQVGVVKGTSGYMSPEQVRNAALDGRTDLFAAAVMLHELLTGQRLFAAPNDAEMMRRIAEVDVPPPSSLNPEVPAELEDVVMKALSLARDDRYATGRELSRAIEQACPDIAHEEQVAELMEQLFADKIATTRALIELANAGDEGGLDRAVAQLSDREEPSGRQKATGFRQKVAAAPPSDETMPPRGRKASVDLDATIAPRRATGVRRPRDRGPATEPGTSPDPTPPSPPARQAARAGSSLSTVVGLLAIVGVLGGAGWALWAGPLKDSGPGLALHEAVRRELDGEPPPPPPPSLEEAMRNGTGEVPEAVREARAQKEREAAEAKRLAEAEAAANDPARLAALKELEAQLRHLDELEDEQRQLKLQAKATSAQGTANAKKLSDLQKQIDDLRSVINAKRGSASAGVQVVTNTQTARAANVGYLTLFTVNPSNAAVFLDGTELGSTPFVRVPLEAGVHALRLVDGDAHDRRLSVTIKAGQTTEHKGIDVSSLPLSP